MSQLPRKLKMSQDMGVSNIGTVLGVAAAYCTCQDNMVLSRGTAVCIR